MELAGLEPATSWVRSRRSLAQDLAWLSACSTCGAASPTPSPTRCAAFSSKTTAARTMQIPQGKEPAGTTGVQAPFGPRLGGGVGAGGEQLGSGTDRRDHVRVLRLPF